MMVRDRELLAAIGRAIYGAEWQAPMADDLGINRQTIRRWLNGDTPLPPDHRIWTDICALARRKAAERSAGAGQILSLIDEAGPVRPTADLFDLIDALRDADRLAYEVGAAALACRLVGDDRLAVSLIDDHCRLVEARRRLAVARAYAPQVEIAAGITVPDQTDESATAEMDVTSLEARMKGHIAACYAIADRLEETARLTNRAAWQDWTDRAPC